MVESGSEPLLSVVKKTTSKCPSLDVRRLEREGRLCPGLSLPYKLGRYGRTVATIDLEAPDSGFGIVVSYDYLKPGPERLSESYCTPIRVEWAPCNYGGVRAWFRCPEEGCGRRVAILYASPHFACRVCHRLAYYSQRSQPHDRALSRAQNIRVRLGGTGNMYEPFPERPKGMHRRTYRRLFHEYRVADCASYPGWLRRSAKTFAA